MRPGFLHRLGREGDRFAPWEIDRRAFSMLFRLLRPHWIELSISVLLLAAGSAVALAPPLLTRMIVDGTCRGFPPGGDATSLAALLVLAAAMAWLIDRSRHRISVKVGQELVTDLRSRLTRAVFERGVRYRDAAGMGILVSVMAGDVDTLSTFASSGVADLLGDSLTMAGCLFVMSRLSPWLTLALLPVFPLMVLGLSLVGGKFRKATRREREAEAAVLSGAEEGVSGQKVIRSVTGEELGTRRFAGLSRQAAKAKVDSSSVFAIILPALSLASSAAMAMVLAVGGYLVTTSHLSVGTVVAFLWYLQVLFGPLRELSVVSQTIAAAAASLERTWRVMEGLPPSGAGGTGRKEASTRHEDPAPQDEAFREGDAAHRPGSIVPARTDQCRPVSKDALLACEGLVLRYGETTVLDSIDLAVYRGSTVLVTGPSGSGKTSLLRCLAGIIEATEGMVYWSGRPPRLFSRDERAAFITYLPQEPFLFPGTIADNLRLARPSATEDEVASALAAVGLEGYGGTDPGEGGRLLSGGQRKLAALACAELRGATVLVMDEPLSGVDGVSATTIRERLEKTPEACSLILSTHRPAEIMIRGCTVIYLEEGRLQDSGSHDDLVNRCPGYRRLWEAQF